MKKLSVVIVSYNVRDYLEQCILSLKAALQSVDGEVIVVDNRSSDDTVAYISRRYPDVRILENHENLGFSKANNRAIRQSRSEYVLLLNPDTVVGEDAIRAGIAFMEAHEDAGALGVKMLQADGNAAPESRRGFPSPFTACCKFMHLHGLFPRWKRFNRYYLSYLPWDVPVEMDVVSGAFMLLRRKALDEVGLLDEDYFMYGEDVDLSYRLKKAGWRNWYLPSEILHYKGQSTQKTSYRYVHVFYGAMLIFLNKHYHGAYWWLKWPLKSLVLAVAGMSLLRKKLRCGRSLHLSRAEEGVVVLGGESAWAECGRILRGKFADVSCCSSVEGMQEGMAMDGKGHHPALVVFDSSSFSCGEILHEMSRLSGRRMRFGIYWAEMRKIITLNNVYVAGA